MDVFSQPLTFWYNLQDPYDMLKIHLPNYKDSVSNHIIKNIFFSSPIITFSYLTIEDYMYLVEYLLSDYCKFDIIDIISFLNSNLLSRAMSYYKMTEENKTKFWILLNCCDWNLDQIVDLAKKFKIDWKTLDLPNKLLSHLLILLEDDTFLSMNLPSVKNENGDFPIHVCVKMRLLNFTRHIITQDSKVLMVKNEDGLLPIDICIYNKDNDMFMLLVPHCNMKSIINLVCSRGTKKMLKTMVKHGYKIKGDCYRIAVLNDNKEVYTWIQKKKNRKCFCM